MRFSNIKTCLLDRELFVQSHLAHGREWIESEFLISAVARASQSGRWGKSCHPAEFLSAPPLLQHRTHTSAFDRYICYPMSRLPEIH